MVRILLADDHDLVRETLAQYLAARGVGPVTQARDAEGVLRLLEEGAVFDLVLLDYNMPGMGGMSALDRVLAAGGVAAVAMISGDMSQGLALEALERGARGFVPKTISPDAFVRAVECMIAGEVFAPATLLDRTEEGALSLREMDVLRGICAGKSNKEIARDFDLQEVTVKLHVKTMSRKLGARNRTHAAMIARDRKLV
ncbi:response regulator [Stagnihabitans tardus]|uniref:Response regulator n=1 Tax=Stagnihabitans tardus TaxID=2699202 RepID=A0AAE4YBK0_9RHOB|nr:response regulator transcription factor [Stagnihabitans tardus]NBZ88361.1 response regulator [Stagnihabitans tardus]